MRAHAASVLKTMSGHGTLARLFSSLLLVGGGALVVRYFARILPENGGAPAGFTVDGERADGRISAQALLEAASIKRLARQVNVVHAGRTVLTGTLAELGASVAPAHASAVVAGLGHQATVWRRIALALRARDGELHTSLVTTLPVEELAARLAPLKERLDTRPNAARWNFTSDRAVPEEDGVLVDLYGTAEAILGAAESATTTPATVSLALRRTPPTITADAVGRIDRSAEVGRYETRFATTGGQRSRAQNVARAAEGIDGVVVMPREPFSFNEHVGPRSAENGFSQAGEIYKGEMRLGIGGGTCQVASTLHAAALFGGFEVIMRSPHSRPSAYIPIGLDATVVYPDVDLRLRNPFEFPVIVRAVAHEGTLTIQLLGRQKMANVELQTATVGETPFKRKLNALRYLAFGRVVRKQAGRKGVVVEKLRTVRFLDGRTVIEKLRDTYPPTTEIYLLGPGATEADLPPLEGDATTLATEDGGARAGEVIPEP